MGVKRMAKTAVVYKSKYGATKQYAQWIKEELGADIFESKTVKAQDLKDYDTVIYGGGLYAGQINGIKFLSQNYEELKDKHLILYTCGLGDDSTETNAKYIQNSINKALSPEIQENIKTYCLLGKMDFKKLNLLHSIMMNMFHKSMKKGYERGKLGDDERKMYENYGKIVDYTNKESLTPMIEYVKGL